MTISAVEANIRLKRPDYGAMLRKLTAGCPEGEDLAEEGLPEEVTALLHEWFDTAEEQEGVETEAGQTDAENDDSEPDMEALEVERAEREEVVINLHAALEQVKRVRDKEKQKKLRAQVRVAEKRLTEATEALKRRTLKGRVELLLDDPKALEVLRRKWIDAEVAKKLDYPVFMATSEQGGKDSSGEYIYHKDPAGSILEDEHGSPLIEQDCVKYREEDLDGIAEHFVKWAKKQRLSFWRED